MKHGRLSLRLARREGLRRPGRTTLVALLVAIPVMGMVLALVLLRTGAHTLDEQWQQQYGAADAVIQGSPSNPALPEGSRAVIAARLGGVRALTDTRHRATLDLDDFSL